MAAVHIWRVELLVCGITLLYLTSRMNYIVNEPC